MILKALKIMPMVIGSFAVKTPILNTTKNQDRNTPVSQGEIYQEVQNATHKSKTYEGSYAYKQYGKTTTPPTYDTGYSTFESIYYYQQTMFEDPNDNWKTYISYEQEQQPIGILATKINNLQGINYILENAKIYTINRYLNTWLEQRDNYQLSQEVHSCLWVTSSSDAEQYFDININTTEPRSIYTWLWQNFTTTLLDEKISLDNLYDFEESKYLFTQQLGRFNQTEDWYELNQTQTYYIFFTFIEYINNYQGNWDKWMETDTYQGFHDGYFTPLPELSGDYETLHIQWQLYSLYTVQEVIDLPGLMFDVLTMPFTFISIGFNLTLWPNTPYQINLSNLFMSIIAILVFGFIMTKILKLKG